MDPEPRLCDYTDSTYRTDFWEGQGREYEDLAERIALRRLLPAAGNRLLDIGAGFGRLSEFYAGHKQVVLLDYSRSLLLEAQERLGPDGRILYVAASFYHMPFVTSAFDTAMTIRVIHHVEDVPAFLGQVSRVLSGSGSYTLEFANKRHLKAILRYAIRRQDWNPFDPSPYEFEDMNFDFHPSWMRGKLAEAGFHVKRQLTASHFRLPLLKRLVSPHLLASLDGYCQFTGEWWQLAPSVFVQCALEAPAAAETPDRLFRCPSCGADDLLESSDSLTCTQCKSEWPINDGVYDFRLPRAT
ncbi:methyltransferase domain-containing protein [Chloroflexota bacterium]